MPRHSAMICIGTVPRPSGCLAMVPRPSAMTCLDKGPWPSACLDIVFRPIALLDTVPRLSAMPSNGASAQCHDMSRQGALA